MALAALPSHHVTYQHGWDCGRRGGGERARRTRPCCCGPVTVDQIGAVGRGGVRMPAKTTFFWPKPRTGMVVRELLG